MADHSEIDAVEAALQGSFALTERAIDAAERLTRLIKEDRATIVEILASSRRCTGASEATGTAPAPSRYWPARSGTACAR